MGALSYKASDVTYAPLTERLQGSEARSMTHGQVEALIHHDGMEILRQLLQGHITLRGLGDVGPAVVGSDGVRRTHKDVSVRRLESIFGEVTVTRLGYRIELLAIPAK